MIVVVVAGVFPQLSQLVGKNTTKKQKFKKSARWLLLLNGNEIEWNVVGYVLVDCCWSSSLLFRRPRQQQPRRSCRPAVSRFNAAPATGQRQQRSTVIIILFFVYIFFLFITKNQENMGKNVLTVPLKFLGFLMCRVAKQLKKNKNNPPFNFNWLL